MVPTQHSALRGAFEWIAVIAIALVATFLIRTFVVEPFVVPTGSMLNTIQEGDRVIASRLAYVKDDPQRYDIVIFKYPDDEKQYYVKRIVGLPGETVEVVNGVVYVTKTDGKTVQLDDSFVTKETPTGNYGPYTVPADSYFMMGDNRNHSEDSRFWQNKFVKKNKIVGKVEFRYYPKFSTID